MKHDLHSTLEALYIQPASPYSHSFQFTETILFSTITLACYAALFALTYSKTHSTGFTAFRVVGILILAGIAVLLIGRHQHNDFQDQENRGAADSIGRAHEIEAYLTDLTVQITWNDQDGNYRMTRVTPPQNLNVDGKVVIIPGQPETMEISPSEAHDLETALAADQPDLPGHKTVFFVRH